MVAKLGYEAIPEVDGAAALKRLESESVDLILTDIDMPRMNGVQLLERVKANADWSDLPVIVISGNQDFDIVIRCIELGAEDYLPKPYNATLLKARITACMEKKRLSDLEAAHLKRLREEQQLSEALLLNVLPECIADRLKAGESLIADNFRAATVVFCDLVGFTEWAAKQPPSELVQGLNSVFSAFDELAERHGLEKIKTIGDAYLVAGGIPNPLPNHVEACVEFAIETQDVLNDFNRAHGTRLQIRTGVHTGPVVAGIIGKWKFIYDLWGDTVNVASRMESHGLPGRVQVSDAVRSALDGRFEFEPRAPIDVKGKGLMQTFFIRAPKGAGGG